MFRRWFGIFYRSVRKSVLHRIIIKSREDIFSQGKYGIEIVGFFKSNSGIGESARLCARYLSEKGYKIKCTSVEKYFRKSDERTWEFDDTANDDQIGCRIIHLNPPMLPPYVLATGMRKYQCKFNIGYWAWELEKIPGEWVKASRYMNAIFCPSDFTSSAIRTSVVTPVITVPHPVSCPLYRTGVRKRLNIDSNKFLVSTVFSFGSGIDRKNPAATVMAFTEAFADENAILVLKANNGSSSIEKVELENLIKDLDHVILVDEQWPSEEVAGLIKESDLFCSLHRSEGFGLTIYEAILLNTPVVTTAWSGNMQFCNANNAYLAPYHLVDVKSRNPEFAGMTEVRWADADVSQSAQLLKKAYAARSMRTNKNHQTDIASRLPAADSYQTALALLSGNFAEDAKHRGIEREGKDF